MPFESRSQGERGLGRLRVQSQRGSAAVEFALVLPLMLLITEAVFSFGIALNNSLMLTNAVTNGAQLLAISRGQVTDPCSTTAAAIFSGAPLLTKANLSFHIVLNGSPYSGTTCTAAAAGLVIGATATVGVNYPCNLSVFGVNFAPGCTLGAQTSELVQ